MRIGPAIPFSICYKLQMPIINGYLLLLSIYKVIIPILPLYNILNIMFQYNVIYVNYIKAHIPIYSTYSQNKIKRLRQFKYIYMTNVVHFSYYIDLKKK